MKMKIMGRLALLSGLALATAMAAAPAQAEVGYADVVLDYFDSGAGPMPGPYGGTFPGTFPVPVSTSVVLGSDGAVVDFLSLPTGSYVTVGFTDEVVFDSPGNDLFISEVGASGELAQIFVTNDLVNYQLLGTADSASLTGFDLASIGFTGHVLGVRVVGLDNFGGSPGFDLANVQALPGAFTALPEPASWALMMMGLGFTGAAMRRRVVMAG